MITEQNILMVSLFGAVGLLSWWVGQLLMRDNGQRLRQRLRNAPERRSTDPGGMTIRTRLEHIGQAAASPFMPKDAQRQSALRRQLGYAGIYSPSAARTVTGCKVLFLGAGLASGYCLGLALGGPMLGLSVGGLVGYVLPTLWLKQRVKIHQRALDYGLPDALDLLVVCVEAGLTIDAAMQRVGQELILAHPRLARELDMTHMETRIGLSRAETLRNLGKRTGSHSLQTLATMLIQADRFGTSIAQSLRIHAESMRVHRQNTAEEAAAKASVKLSFPVVLFIFPAVLIVLAGPAVIGLFKSALFAE